MWPVTILMVSLDREIVYKVFNIQHILHLVVIGSIGLAALYIWNNADKIEMDLSFKIDLKQSELEKDLYREVA